MLTGEILCSESSPSLAIYVCGSSATKRAPVPKLSPCRANGGHHQGKRRWQEFSSADVSGHLPGAGTVGSVDETVEENAAPFPRSARCQQRPGRERAVRWRRGACAQGCELREDASDRGDAACRPDTEDRGAELGRSPGRLHGTGRLSEVVRERCRSLIQEVRRSQETLASTSWTSLGPAGAA